MADFQLKVTAETQRAEKDLQRLDRTVNEATKDRKLRIDIGELNKSFSNVEKNIKEAGNAVQSFYRVSKNIPGIGERVKEFESLAKGTVEIAKNAPASAAALRENAKAGSILTNSLQTAGGAATTLIDALASTGLAIFAVKEAVGVLRGVFGGFFNETIGREIKLRETILKTQTTLASTSKVFRNGQEITDPYEKIVSLTGEVRKNIDSIRVRSLELAGVTSNDVIEVFGIVAQQVSQIGGGLKEAEDLAIQFSAALGTFGLPLYQARQEIGSILRGEITEDSYLAKSLLISSKDIEKAKTQAGGVVKFLEERLSAAVAGQKIAAQGFAGITSNIREIAELTTQAFGAGLLDPLLGGLTNVYTLLFRIAKQLQDIAKTAGTGLGQILANSLTVISGNSALLGGLGNATEGLANQIKAAVESAFQSLATDAASVLAPIQNLFEEVLKSVAVLAQGLSNLAVGFASIQIENFKALVQVFSNLTEVATIFAAGLGSILSAYGSLLQVPFVQYLSQISAQFKLLEAIGVKSAIQLAAVALTVLANWKPVVAFFQVQFARAVVAAGAVVAGLGAAFSQIAAVIAAFASTLAAAIPNSEALQASLTKLSASLGTTGASATEAGARLTSMAGASGAAASKLGSVVFNLIKFNLIILAVTGAITILIDLFGRWQRAKDKEVSDSRAEKSLALLATRYKNVGDNADAATKAAKNFHEAVVNARYQRAISEVEQLSQKLAELEEDMNRPVRWALDGWFKNWALNRIPEIKKQLENALKDRDKWARTNDRSNTEESIRIEAQNRVNFEKEIGDLRRQIDSDIFQQRQALAQKEVDIFRAAGELRVLQMEQANKKLIEGEEGASRTALEALNNYLSVRERGELDIEAAKKSLVIEAANLEREISNYRLENEKKIAEIRKRAGDYEQKMADYRRQAAGQVAAGSGGGAATFGATGNVDNGAGWVHGHFQTNTGTLNDLISDVIPVLKALLDQGVPVELPNGARVAAGKDDAYYRNILTKAAGQHKHSGDGRSLDLFVPEGTKVPVPLTNITGNTGRAGITGGLPGTGKSWVGHLAPGSKAGGSGALAPPTAPSFSDIGAPAVTKYAEAVRNVASAMERLRALQAALTDARTKEAFDAIAKAAFQPVALEQYTDELDQVQLTYKAVSEASADAFNPERTQIAIEQAVKVRASERELEQIMKAVAERAKLSEKEKAELTKQVTAQHQKYVQSLKQEEVARQRILTTQKASDLLQRLKEETAQAKEEIEVIKKRNQLEYDGASPEVIAAEEAKLRIRQELNRSQQEFTEKLQEELNKRDEILKRIPKATDAEKAQLQKDLDAALKQIELLKTQLEALPKAGADRLKVEDDKAAAATKDPVESLLGRWKAELKDVRAMVASLAQTVQSELASAMSAAIIGVIDGTTTIGEAFGQMFKNIGKAFIDMATEMISKMLVMYLLQQVLGLLGGVASGGFKAKSAAAGKATFGGSFRGTGASTFGPGAIRVPGYASGGFVTGPTHAVVGEGSEPEYIIPASKMQGAMSRYAAGVRGAAVIPGNGASGGGGGAMGSGSGTIDVRYTVERINSVDYVTADQFQRGMAQAAKQGAEQGERRALGRLQNSPATRRRVGV